MDEMDAWFKTEEFKNLGRLIKYIYAQSLTEEANKLLKSRCDGCQTDHPGQQNHICIDPQPASNPFILYLYAEALESIDLTRVESTFHRSRKILNWGYGSNAPRQDYSWHIKKCVSVWYFSDFASLDSDLKVDDNISEAVTQARKDLGIDQSSELA